MMNALDKLNGRSVLVIANYRTGSTALCDLLSKHTGYQNLDEHFNPSTTSNTFDKYLDKKIIVKVMPDHHPTGDTWQHLLDNFFIIGVARRDLTAQIASFYICDKTQIWHEKKNAKIHIPTVIDINDNDIENQCRYILDQHSQYEQLKQHFDVELMYEDIQHELVTTDYNQYPKPSNYDQIKTCIRQFLTQQGY